MTFNDWIKDCPISHTLANYWDQQNQSCLDMAAFVLSQLNVNPWVFTADARHFWQFATAQDVIGLHALTTDQQNALLDWDEDDWNPETFGYQHP